MKKLLSSPYFIPIATTACTVSAPFAWLFIAAFLMERVAVTSPVMSSGNGSQSGLAAAFILVFVVLPAVAVLGGATTWAVLTHRGSDEQKRRIGAWAAYLCGAVVALPLLCAAPLAVQGEWHNRALPPPGSLAALINPALVWIVSGFPALWAVLLALWGWREKRRLITSGVS